MKHFVLLCLVLPFCISPGMAIEGWTSAGTNLGATTTVIPSLVHQNVMYAGSYEGFFVSFDEGLNWEKRSMGDFQYIMCSETTPEVIICGSNDHFIRVSEDQGETWVNFEITLPDSIHCNGGSFCPGNPDEAFLSSSLGIFRLSRTEGEWQEPERIIENPWKDPAHNELMFFPDDPDTFFVVTTGDEDLRVMERNGTAWLIQGDYHPSGESGSLISLALDPDTNMLFAGTTSGKLYKTSRNPISWTPVEVPVECQETSVNSLLVSDFYGLVAEFDGQIYSLKDNLWKNLQSPAIPGINLYSLRELSWNKNLVIGGSSGCFVYHNYLRTWSVRNRGIHNIDLKTACFHPTSERDVLLGTYGLGVFFSVDGGVSWIQSNKGLPSLLVNKLVRDPFDPDTVYAACIDALAVSHDNGRSWTRIGSIDGVLTNNAYTLNAFPIAGNTVLFVGTFFPNDGKSLVYKSVDGGVTLTSCNTPFDEGAIGFFHQSLSDENKIFCGSETSDNAGRLWCSENAGFDFIDCSPATWGSYKIPKAMVTNPENSQEMWMAVSRKGAYRTLDGGDTWIAPTAGGVPYWTSMAYDSGTQDVLCMAADETIYPYREIFLSYDYGQSWNWSGQFETTKRTNFIVSDPYRNRIWVARRDGFFWESKNQAQSWELCSKYYISTPFNVNDIAVSPQYDNILFMATEGNGVYKSVDSGWSWTEINNGIPESHRYVRCLDIDTRNMAENEIRLLLGCADSSDSDHRIFETIDSGTTWNQKDVSGDFQARIVDLIIEDQNVNKQKVWLATYGDGVWLSQNNGADWDRKNLNPSPQGQLLTSISQTSYADDHDEPWIFVSTHGGGGSFVWDPGSDAFIVRNNGIPGAGQENCFVDFIAADPDRFGVIWAGTTEGLYKSADFGFNWEPSFSTDPYTVTGHLPKKSSIAFNNGDVFYLQKDLGVFRSQSGFLNTWSSLETGLSENDKSDLSGLFALGTQESRQLFGLLNQRSSIAHPASSVTKSTGADIFISQPLYYPGDLFTLDIQLNNSSQDTLKIDLYLALEAGGEYFFWPEWSATAASQMFTVPEGFMDISILEFIWPENVGSGNVNLYTLMLDQDSFEVVGDLDWVPFGWLE